MSTLSTDKHILDACQNDVRRFVLHNTGMTVGQKMATKKLDYQFHWLKLDI